jgi:hypothetical protein
VHAFELPVDISSSLSRADDAVAQGTWLRKPGMSVAEKRIDQWLLSVSNEARFDLTSKVRFKVTSNSSFGQSCRLMFAPRAAWF